MNSSRRIMGRDDRENDEDQQEQQQNSDADALPLSLQQVEQQELLLHVSTNHPHGRQRQLQQQQQQQQQRDRTLLSSSSLQQRSRRRGGSRRDRKLAKTLYVASEALLDRLFSYLSRLPEEEEEEEDVLSLLQRNNNDVSSSTGITLPASAIGWLASQIYGHDDSDDNDYDSRASQQKGDDDSPSLFASQQQEEQQQQQEETEADRFLLAPNASSNNVMNDTSLLSASVHDRVSLLKYLLPRLRHLRISGADPWPSNSRKKTTTTIMTQSSTNNQDIITSITNNEDDASLLLFTERHYHNLRYRPCVDLRLFPNLRVLVLHQVPPEWLRYLASLRHLQVLRMEQSGILNLPRLFYDTTGTGTTNTTTNAPQRRTQQATIRSGDVLLMPEEEEKPSSSSFFFPSLKLLKLSHCSLTSQALGNTTITATRASSSSSSNALSCPLSRLTHLQAISLAHNELFQSAPVLRALRNKPFLSKLDLSHNRLSGNLSGPLAPLCLGNLQCLYLSHNRLTSTRHSIDHLYSLETLWLDHNCLADVTSVAGLARLGLLSDLKLCGNPMETTSLSSYNNNGSNKNSSLLQKAYRVHVLDLFLQQRLPLLSSSSSSRNDPLTCRQMQLALPRLDGELASIGEMKALRERVFTFVTVTVPPPPLQTQTLGTATGTDDEYVLVEKRQSSSCRNNDNHKGHVSTSNPRHRQQQQQQQRRRGQRRMMARIDNQEQTEETKEKRLLFAVDRRKPDPDYIPSTKFTVADVLECISADKTSESSSSSPSEAEEKQNVSGEGDADAEEGHTRSSNHAGHQEGVAVNETDTSLTMNAKASSSDQKTQQQSPFDEAVSPLVQVVDSAGVSPTGSAEQGQGHVAEAKWHPEEEEDLISAPSVNDAQLEKDLGIPFPLSPISHALKSSEATTAASTAADTNVDVDGPETPTTQVRSTGKEEELHHKSESSKEPVSSTSSPPEDPEIASTERSNSSQGDQLPMRVVSSLFQDDISVATSAGGKSSSLFDETSAQQKYVLAEEKSIFNVNTYKRLNVLDNLELYFQLFVFNYSMLPSLPPPSPDKNSNNDYWLSVLEHYPKIQMWPLDRRMREAYEEKAQLAGKLDSSEELRRVWKERVVACGKPALRRLTPSRGARFGFHGELLWSAASTSHIKPETIAEPRDVLICLSNTSIYFIANHDSVSSRTIANDPNRKFPLTIPEDATFQQAKWPHALAWHPFHTLTGITIGFGFQRLTLRFSNSTFPSPDDFTYILLTSNKLETVSLLKEIQSLASEARTGTTGGSLKPFHINNNNNRRFDGAFQTMAQEEEAVKIDNDDRHVLDALGVAVAPDVIGAVLHYQILSQYWRHGDRGVVRRVCVVTDTTVYLLDEDYVGDGSESLEAGHHRVLGETTYRVVDSAPLAQISVVRAADADPCAMTMSIRSTSRLSRTHNWRLTCRDRHGAEQLVEDVRKAIAMAV